MGISFKINVAIKNEELNKRLKIFCVENKKKIFDVAEEVIKEHIDRHNDKGKESEG